VIIGLLYDEKTDKITAFRTSRAMIAAGMKDIEVSMYIFRDSRSDRMGEEKYLVMFYDTPEQEKNLVVLFSDVLENRELDMPKTMRVTLRSFSVAGSDLPVYSLTDNFFIVCDGTVGQVSLFDEFYTNTFDGQTFESDYLRIDGIRDGNISVTIRKGQPIWPEKTDETNATDLNGTHYEYVDNVWQDSMAAGEQHNL
jgi:hypothetical protein